MVGGPKDYTVSYLGKVIDIGRGRPISLTIIQLIVKKKVPKSTKKYRRVPKSTQKYQEVPKSTKSTNEDWGF